MPATKMLVTVKRLTLAQLGLALLLKSAPSPAPTSQANAKSHEPSAPAVSPPLDNSRLAARHATAMKPPATLVAATCRTRDVLALMLTDTSLSLPSITVDNFAIRILLSSHVHYLYAFTRRKHPIIGFTSGLLLIDPSAPYSDIS